MLLDNFTIIAQLINFLILIWLLKRFLYGPILAAIDAREQRLRDQQQQALSEQDAARSRHQQLAQMQQQLQEQQQQLLQETRDQAEQERQRLIEQSRKEIISLREQWQQRLTSEQQEVVTRLQQNTEQAMLQTLKAIVTELATSNLQQAMVATFIQRLASLDEKQLNLLRGQPINQQSAYKIVSAKALSASETEQLEEAITKLTEAGSFHYTLNSELLCGIELHHNGHKLSWSLAGHLERLHRNLATLDSQQRGQS